MPRRRATSVWQLLRCAAGILAITAMPLALADDESDDEENPFRPGIVATYRGADGAPHARLESDLSFAWGSLPPERRVAEGPFEATFRGLVLVQSPGLHTFRVYAAGAVKLVIDGQVVLDSATAEPAWLESKPIELEFGHRPLELQYRRTTEPARVSVFWEGPQFMLEPLAARWLFHEAAHTPKHRFDDGATLVRSLRCAACHQIDGEPAPMAAPALDRLAGNISRGWMIDRLAARATSNDPTRAASRRMPHLPLDRAQAEAVTDYLLATSEATPRSVEPRDPPAEAKKKKEKKKSDEEVQAPKAPNAADGSLLFHSVGCLACHRVGELGQDGPFGGGDLVRVAEKRASEFFDRWLTEPAALNRHHRMPVFELTPLERGHLVEYLKTLRAEGPATAEQAKAPDERGRELVRQFRCAECHALPKVTGLASSATKTRIDAASCERAGGHCLGEPDAATHRPGYRLDESSRQAVVEFLRQLKPNIVADRPGGELLAEHNCLACHARGLSRGLAAQVPAIVDAVEELRQAHASLAPPALIGVGDKLHDESLAAAITRSAAPRYTWLKVRMPKFDLSGEESRALVRHFIDTDRVPALNRDAAQSVAQADATVEAAGARLVTADGFGCTSCHAIGKWQPQKIAPGSEGADLSNLGSRIRRDWFDRWVRNPARVIPQMEMPSVVQPVRGVLDGRLSVQLAAVWHVLDRKGFTPPSPNALRVLRRANLEAPERAAVLTDLVEIEGRPFVKPLVIGLSNRHNVLFDLATGRLAAWWMGDTARQQTRGKSWFWEGGAGQLLPLGMFKSGDVACDLAIRTKDGIAHAQIQGQYTTELDTVEHTKDGVRFTHRLRFDVDEPHQLVRPGRDIVARVTQEFSPLAGSTPLSRSGFVRRVSVEPFENGHEYILEVVPGAVELSADKRSASVSSAGRKLSVELRLPERVTLQSTNSGATVSLTAIAGWPATCELVYRVDAAADQFAQPPIEPRTVEPATLDLVPGYSASRLALSDRMMPTGLAWRPDGSLIVSSLEGRVWLAQDTDNDGLEDFIEPFSDELAAPYGVAAHGDAVDVINKYGLLRLTDTDGDRRADRTELLASGWGHTRDYHDWAIGLPRDVEGNYYISLPCQQDERTPEAARLRGSIIKLVPRDSTPADPHRYTIEPLCGGMRFANGLALSPAGDLFATDNQGNYTPFNELNHIVKDARYGFINRLEQKAGFSAPVRMAAVEIPHPWTRSVNGICFLTSPSQGEKSKSATAGFGPFEGHLIGCEYDTRRLVRISLERVAGEFQGAVYPFSREPAIGQESFEGPLVCAVSPGGELYVGSIRDSGWGAGNNTGSIVRLRPSGELPCGIAEVKATRGGFQIAFTQPVDPARAASPKSYVVSSYRRTATPAYGGPDQDRHVDRVHAVRLADDRKHVEIDIENLREGFVYEFHVARLAEGGQFFPAEAHYTLRHKLSE